MRLGRPLLETDVDQKTPQRSRTITWEDPGPSASAIRKLSGLEFLRKIRDGEIANPPIAQTLDFRLTRVEPGEATFECDAAEFHYNPAGGVHGGMLATLLDSAMTCAVRRSFRRHRYHDAGVQDRLCDDDDHDRPSGLYGESYSLRLSH
jgi:hypothetical protein